MSVRSVVDFYDQLADDYHLLYGDRWDAAVERQGGSLARLIGEVYGARRVSVLDCTCGIGTQAIGLALLGYRVRGSDISGRALERARSEAARLGARVELGVADVRDLSSIDETFDVVISCDNALPHLLDDSDLMAALAAMRSKLRPNGLLIVTIRDHERLMSERRSISQPLLIPGPPLRVVIRLHEWDAPDSPLYTVRLIVLTETVTGWNAREHATRYRAITRSDLGRMAEAAGFGDVRWRGDEVVRDQPVMLARSW